MPWQWTSKIWFLGKSNGDDHVPVKYFKNGDSGDYVHLSVDRVTWGIAGEAAQSDCHRKEDLGSRNGGMG